MKEGKRKGDSAAPVALSCFSPPPLSSYLATSLHKQISAIEWTLIVCLSPGHQPSYHLFLCLPQDFLIISPALCGTQRALKKAAATALSSTSVRRGQRSVTCQTHCKWRNYCVNAGMAQWVLGGGFQLTARLVPWHPNTRSIRTGSSGHIFMDRAEESNRDSSFACSTQSAL